MPLRRALGALSPSQCRQSASCTAAENLWCYSAGALTSDCIAWRAGFDTPPAPPAPPPPPIDTAGGSTADNPDYGRAPADWTVQDQADASAAAFRLQTQKFFDEIAGRNPPAPPGPTSADYWLKLAIFAAILSAFLMWRQGR